MEGVQVLFQETSDLSYHLKEKRITFLKKKKSFMFALKKKN